MSLSPLSAAIVIGNPMLREESLGCLTNLPVRIVIDQRVLDDPEELLDSIERHRVDVLLLEGNLLKAPLEELTRRLKLTASDPVIFVLQCEAVAEQILEAMQAGAREYLCPPLVTPLREAFERLASVRGAQVSTQQKKLGKVFGFLSAKGGCGATTFASHVAAAAARHARRPLLVADLDFEAGLLRFILKAKSRYSVCDALNNMHRMDSSFWQALVSKHDYLEFLAAPEELIDRTPPDPRHLSRFLRFVRTIYPTTVLDFGRWHSTAAMESLPEMESLFLVVTQELQALENAREIIRFAVERNKASERIKILVNRVSLRQKPDMDGLAKYLGVRPAGVFCDDTEALYETWSEGRMLGTESALGRQFAALAKSLTDTDVAAQVISDSGPTPPTASTLGSLGRMLSSLRGRARDENTAVAPSHAGSETAAAGGLRAMIRRRLA